MQLGKAAALKVGSGSFEAGAAIDPHSADAFARLSARLDRHWYAFADANARWQQHKRATYSVAGGIGASW